jgi:DNA invertase Pin-like site-specific DNA recombinase
MKKVIELIRVSTEAQAATDRASIPAQKAVNLRTCVNFGLEIVRSIQMADVSGACVSEAPEMHDLIEAMQSPNIDGVVAREFSRLMRPENFEDYRLLQAFVDSKTVLYLPEGPLDLSSKIGRFVGTIRAAVAGMERMDILERIWSAKEEKRRRGELAQSTVVLPFGVGYEQSRGFYYKPKSERVREAFRLFLGGEQNYAKLSRMVGVSSRGMHVIMRNPIWKGWRVIDQKRDLSSAGRYLGINGRQADRRKIARAPEEVIRRKVISEPLVSDDDWQAVQQIMDMKEARHWRTQPEVEHRFTYNGFLTCAACGQVIHTALCRRDYYACRGRRSDHTCSTKYMAREKLEERLDFMFAQQLTSPYFLEGCVKELAKRTQQKDSDIQIHRLTAAAESLRQKRERILEAFFDGTISAEERKRRLESVDHDLKVTNGSLARSSHQSAVSLESLANHLAVLAEWQYWTRDQKRRVLMALCPDIHVADYQVTALGIHPTLFSNENSRRDKGSWPPRA